MMRALVVLGIVSLDAETPNTVIVNHLYKVVMTSTFRLFSLSRVGIVALIALFSQTAVPQDQQSVPDAPSATRPAPAQLPKNVPPAATTAPDSTQQQQSNPQPPPPNNIKTVPAGSVPPDTADGRDDLYKIIVRVNQVTVP